jgi:hypothetical protein
VNQRRGRRFHRLTDKDTHHKTTPKSHRVDVLRKSLQVPLRDLTPLHPADKLTNLNHSIRSPFHPVCDDNEIFIPYLRRKQIRVKVIKAVNRWPSHAWARHEPENTRRQFLRQPLIARRRLRDILSENDCLRIRPWRIISKIFPLHPTINVAIAVKPIAA